MSKAKELYEKYKGMKATSDGVSGIVCGYVEGSEHILIIVTNNDRLGWEKLTDGDIVITDKDSTGNKYWYVDEDDVEKTGL